jgi:hypothetical protein
MTEQSSQRSPCQSARILEKAKLVADESSFIPLSAHQPSGGFAFQGF